MQVDIRTVTLFLGILGALLVVLALARLWLWLRFHLMQCARRLVAPKVKADADVRRPISRTYEKK